MGPGICNLIFSRLPRGLSSTTHLNTHPPTHPPFHVSRARPSSPLTPPPAPDDDHRNIIRAEDLTFFWSHPSGRLRWYARDEELFLWVSSRPCISCSDNPPPGGHLMSGFVGRAWKWNNNNAFLVGRVWEGQDPVRTRRVISSVDGDFFFAPRRWQTG